MDYFMFRIEGVTKGDLDRWKKLTRSRNWAASTIVLALAAIIIYSIDASSAQDFKLKVDAKANIFGTGQGGVSANGGGASPPSVRFDPTTAAKYLTFSSVSGTVSCCGTNGPYNEADGGTNAGGTTDISSAGGISGIIHPSRTMFLVGVFLDDSAPSAPAPARLTATTAENLTPKLYQTFFIGAGKGREITVPPTATRLFLGFADASSFNGAPGYYDDNAGELLVEFRIAPTHTTSGNNSR